MNDDYLAGFVDGEGCVHIEKDKNYYRCRIFISNTNKNILEKIQEQYGGSLYEHKKRITNRKTIYHLDFSGEKAQQLIKQIKDKLIIKQTQAELFCLFPLNFGCGNKTPQFIKDFQEQLYNEMKTLNKRGE